MEPKSEPMEKSFENKSEALKEEGSPSGKPPPVKKNKSDALKEEESSSGKPPLVKKEEKLHPTHSFSWKSVEQKTTFVSCDRAGTVEESLKRNPFFEGIAKKNKDKELVLLRNGKAICSHFPCSLIQDECLEVKFIKAVNTTGEKAGGSAHVRRKGSSDEVVVFHVRVTGGKGVKRILKNPDLKNDIGVDELTIYAYKRETVKQALRRDARFLDIVFKKKCVLSTDDFVVTKSNLVDDLGGKTYTINEVKNLPDSQPSSLEEDWVQSAESQRPEPEENQDPSEQSVNDDTNTSGHTAAEPTPLTISAEIMSYLSSQFENLMNGEITVPFRDGNKTFPMTEILRVEYGKNAQTCTDVKTMKKLMGFSNSVCQVRLHDGSTGTGFLLFDRFVLTNAHVVKDDYNESLKKLSNKVIVHFSYESLNQMEREQDSVAIVEVEEVAGFEYTEDVYDWALLKLRAGVNLPNGLLNKCGDLNKSHGVRIIGHPDGGVKKIETCLSIAPEKQKQVVEKSRIKQKENTKENQGVENNSVKIKDNTILITDRYFKKVTKQLQRRKNILTYKTCFNEGSSGSPVFDKDCNVLAMHSGGYTFIDKKTDTTKSVIEFGYSLFDIIERIKIQLVGKKEADVTFKEFFEFCDKEEPVPMDTC